MKMKKKSMFSKMLAVCLALVFALSMSVTAFAAITPDETGSFTVTGLDTDPAPSVSAYQIITVNVDANGQPSYPMYTWNAAVAEWLKANSYAAYVNDNLGTNAVADAFDNADAGTMTTFLEKLTAAIKAGTVRLAPSKTVTAADGTASFADMAMGEYLITANGGVKIYQPTTVKLVPEETDGEWNLADATAEMKSSDPGIDDKEASTEEGDKTVAIGDTVTYKLTVTVPSYPEDATNTSFVVSDQLSEGLTFDGVSTIHVYSDADLQTEVDAANYTATTTGVVEGRTFQIDFNDAFTKGLTVSKLYITYTATVNENAFGTDALGNKPFLGYDNDPYTESDHEVPGPDEDVYTYGIDLRKVDKDGTAITSETGDKKARFTLSDDTGAVLKFEGADGVYKYKANGTETLEVAADGTLSVQGLDEGTYTLKETQAPEGYVLPTGKITIVIEDADPDGEIDEVNVSKDGTIVYTNATAIGNVVSFDVQNTSSDDAGFTLPTTGGMGTMIFTIAGVLLMAGAVTMIVVVSKKRKAE